MAENSEVKELKQKLLEEVEHGFARDNEAKQVVNHMQELLKENTHANKTNFTVVVHPFDDTKKIWVPPHHFEHYRFNVEPEVTGTLTES